MPKIKTKSLSAMVREMLEQMGMDASPTEISQKLRAQGHKASPNLVSGIKNKMKSRKTKTSRRQISTAPAMNDQPSINDVYEVWALANRIGNDKLKQIASKMP